MYTPLTPTHVHSPALRYHAHSHIIINTHIHSCTLTRTLIHAHAHSCTLMHTHAHSRTVTHTSSTLTLSFTLTHTHSHSLTLAVVSAWTSGGFWRQTMTAHTRGRLLSAAFQRRHDVLILPQKPRRPRRQVRPVETPLYLSPKPRSPENCAVEHAQTTLRRLISPEVERLECREGERG